MWVGRDISSMNLRERAGTQFGFSGPVSSNSKSRVGSVSRLGFALSGATMLAGVPVAALAQESVPTAQPTPAPAPAPATNTIRSINVVGAERLEPTTILSYIRLRVGQEYTSAAADEALKDLGATELFADFSIRNEGGNVVITVTENPVINRIVLEGNDRIDNDKILPEIRLSPRQIFTRSKVRADVARIIELYKRQGRFAATVEPQMVSLPQNRVDIVFEITEGPKSKVRQINIIGNEKFSDGELRGEMVTKQSRFFRFFSSNTSYDPDRLAFDQQKLRQFYLTEGYADFRVVSAVAELTPDQQDFIITYVVEEGERYNFGDVEVDSQIRDFDGDALAAGLGIQSGDFYDAKIVEDTVESLTELAGRFGYAFADVQPRFNRNPDDLTMDITFILREAPRVYIERVDVNGNTLSQDKVIRREFRVSEGDAFNSLGVQRTTARINSLGYFQENFEVTQVEGSAPDRIVLEANVEEQPTGELQFSAGFSSIERFIISGSVRQRNFRGRGQTVGLSLNLSQFSRAAQVSFTEPYVFDRNISAGADIYRRDFNNRIPGRRNFGREIGASFEQATTGGSIRVGAPLTEFMSLIASYTLNYDQVTVAEDVFFTDSTGNGRGSSPDDVCDVQVSRFLCDALGNRLSSIVGLSLSYNTLNSAFRPTRGRSVSLSTEFAGLGGDVRYLRFRGQGRQFWDVFNSGFIFSLSAEGGVVLPFRERTGVGVDDVFLTDRFFLGEPQFRGFDIRGVGPRILRQNALADGDNPNFALIDDDGNVQFNPDRERQREDALGGRYYYLGRAELELPLGTGARELGLRPSIWLDVGALWGLTTPVLNSSAVFSQRVESPRVDGDGNPVLDDNGNQIIDVGFFDTLDPTDEDGNPNAVSSNNFREIFVGNSPSPRVTAGIGVNWNSPFGPFRIDFAQTIRKVEGDDDKQLTFNVGTQF